MRNNNDGSSALRTQRGQSQPPALSQFGGSTVRNSGLRTELSLESGLDQQHSDRTFNSSPQIDVKDYINNGLAHTDESPLADSVATPGSSMNKAFKIQPQATPTTIPYSPVAAGVCTPPRRNSLQCTMNHGYDSTGIFGNGPNEGTGSPMNHRRGQSLISKIKAFASPGPPQTPARFPCNNTDHDEPLQTPPITTLHTGNISGFSHDLTDGDSDADADAEETADEGPLSGANPSPRKKRRLRRPRERARASPSVPKVSRAPAAQASDKTAHSMGTIAREGSSNTLEQRGHVSEGEGRDRFASHHAWRRGNSWLNGQRGQIDEGDADSPSRRPSNFRRITGFGGHSDNEGHPSRRLLFSSDRATTFGVQRWRMLRQGLKLLSKKDDHRGDYLKSAELMAELRAGAPAVLMLASMMQRDDKGNKRIPVLLEQLKLRVTDSRPGEEEGIDKEPSFMHSKYRIELEYGSGLNRMKWVVSRTFRDFTRLHSHYRLKQNKTDNKPRSDDASRMKRPKFPKSAFPLAAKFIKWLGDTDSEEEADAVAGEETAAEASQSEVDKASKKPRPSFSAGGRQSSRVAASTSGLANGTQPPKALAQRARRKLEKYLHQMIRWLIFRPDSNRLCRFLELSSLGVRLAAEGTYHGKEGFLNIVSAKGLDVRRYVAPSYVFNRHSQKWFLVRHSYIVCVESPETMHIYDVYMVDSKFEIISKRRMLRELGPKQVVGAVEASAKHPGHFGLRLVNSERKIKLFAKNERLLWQFEESIASMLKFTLWSKPNRFQSFAPVRTGAFAQWLVDGRDYMWNVSRALNMAKDVIYIHDWWLSPQLYMRRPAAISQKWRLDRLLQKKAREGVKIFIIIYRNVEAAIPIDSEFTKFSMLDLHPNIFVQRSPNQFKKNQFFYAHHEKICIVDHTVAFVGGLDLCFGRWDTPQHLVVDDKPTGFEHSDSPKDADHCQLWPGKDYSNPRVQDFYKLSEPYAEMYDRSKTPRMPWHDVSMQVVGQPARDLTRHFVQRWNYVLRGRKPTRPTPFLLPPPDYNSADLEALGLTGTCEVQILRSACDWSLGLTSTEHSIMNAYCKMIEESEHFVYMENQFFITSCETMNTKITNKIGNAIVERAVRAFRNDEKWHCVIVIPLMPGFQNTVDEPEGTSVRLIMQCQFRSICRGEESIFGRLRSEDIEPEEFISFYSLRSWGKIGPNKTLVTEQLYIHAKVIIVDDRIALIGSANINERSMLGVRDSECAAVVRDTDMLWSTMNGKPYLVGRFAHTLRMRLMREHLGVDVDMIMEEERQTILNRDEEELRNKMDAIYDGVEDDEDDDQAMHSEPERPSRSRQSERLSILQDARSSNHDSGQSNDHNPISEKIKRVTADRCIIGNAAHAADVDGKGPDHWTDFEQSGLARARDTVLASDGREVLVETVAPEGRGTVKHPGKSHKDASPPRKRQSSSSSEGGNAGLPPPAFNRLTTEQLGFPPLSQLPPLPVLEDTDIGGPPAHFAVPCNATSQQFNPLTADIKPTKVDRDCMRDPLNDSFFDDTWRLVAENNTKIFRKVFRCNPDSEVTNWHEYTEFVAYAERLAQSQGGGKSHERAAQEAPGKSGPPGATMPTIPAAVGGSVHHVSEKVKNHGPVEDHHPLGTVSQWAADARAEHDRRSELKGKIDGIDEKAATRSLEEPPTPARPTGDEPFPQLETISEQTSNAQTLRRTTFSSCIPEKTTSSSTHAAHLGSVKRRRRGTTKTGRKGFSASDDLITIADAEELLGMVQGHLVQFPYDWLAKEEANSNWLYQVDQVAPLQIYD